MGKFRTVVAYKNHFEDFLSTQPIKVQNKIYKIIELIETLGIVPSRYIKKLKELTNFMKQDSRLEEVYGECFVFLMKGVW